MKLPLEGRKTGVVVLADFSRGPLLNFAGMISLSARDFFSAPEASSEELLRTTGGDCEGSLLVLADLTIVVGF